MSHHEPKSDYLAADRIDDCTWHAGFGRWRWQKRSNQGGILPR